LDSFSGFTDHVLRNPRLNARANRHSGVNNILHCECAGRCGFFLHSPYQSGEPTADFSVLCGSLRFRGFLLCLLFPDDLNVRLVVGVDQGIKLFDTRCYIRGLWAGLQALPFLDRFPNTFWCRSVWQGETFRWCRQGSLGFRCG
jgi:hypothetical protein